MQKTSISLKAALAVCVCVFVATASWAASGVWNGTVNTLWTSSANWSASPYPAVNDTASFTNNGSGQTTIDVSGLAGITSIIFDSPAVAAYTIGAGATNSQTLVLADNGVITLTSTAANSQRFNCGLQLGATTAAATYTITNGNTSQTLIFNKIFGAPSIGTAGAKTLNVNGAGNTTILRDISKGGATSLTINDNSTGTLTLSGTNTLLTLYLNAPTNVVDIGSGTLFLSNAGQTVLQANQNATINGSGSIWLSMNSGTDYADVKPVAGKTLVINPSIISAGGFEHNDSGTAVLNGINTFPGEISYTGAGGTISVSKIGNRGSTTSNLGMGSRIIMTVDNCKLVYTGTGETSDRLFQLSQNNFTIDQSGPSGKLSFSTSPTVSAGTRNLKLQGSTAAIGEFSAPLGNNLGTLAIFKDGSGTWILSGVNTYSGATTVNAGKLLFNSPGTSVGSAVTVNNGAILGGNTAINGNVTLNAGGMLAPGDVGTAGTLSLGVNLALNSGTLIFDVSTAASDKVSVVGSLTVNGTNTVVLSFPAGTLPAGTYTLMTFSSLNGIGAFALSPAYVNASLQVNATSLQLVVSNTGISNKVWKGNVSGNWDGTDLNWTNGSAAVSFAPGDAVLFDDSASLFNVTSAGTVSPGSVVFNNNINTYVVPAAMDGSWGLMKLGAGNVTLSGTNTYAGQTTIAGGILTIGDAGVLGNGNYAMNIIDNGAFNYASSAVQTNSGVISGIGALTLSGSGTMTLSGTNTYTGATTVNGPGTLVISGNNAACSGQTVINAGTLRVLSASALGTIAAGTTVNTNGTLELGGNVVTLLEPLSLFGTLSSQTGSNTYAGAVTFQQGSTINVGAGSTNILSASTAGAGAFSKTGLGLLRITADPGHTGVTTINQGAVELAVTTLESDTVINNGASLIASVANAINDANNVIVNAGGSYVLRQSDTINMFSGAGTLTQDTTNPVTLTVGNSNGSSTFSGVIQNGSGTMSFAKIGTGIQTLSGVNSYTGTTTVIAGTLSLRGTNVLSALSAVSLSNATLQVLQDGSGNNGPTTFGKDVTLNGPVTATIDVGNNGSGNTGNTVAFGALNNGTTNNAFNSTISFTGANGYLQSFTTLCLSGLTGYGTTLNPTTTSVTILGNVTNQITTVSTHYDTLVLDGTSASNKIMGVISDAAGYTSVNNGDTRVTKSNTSTWTLAATNTYRGPTVVNGGTLIINGSISSTNAVTVASGATLGGFGTIKGAGVILSAGGLLAPGDVNAVGTLSITNTLTLNGNTLTFDVSNAATDKVAVASALTVNSANTVVLNFPGGPLAAGTYTLMTFASKAGAGTFALDKAYPNASLTPSNTNLVLTVAAGGTSWGKTWKGNVSASWDGADLNWAIGSVATNFVTGDVVTFDDTATSFSVSSAALVTPSLVLFNNRAGSYTVSSAIGGTGPLVTSGSGMVTLSGTNTFSGPITNNAGTLMIGGAGLLGNGFYATNIFNNGTFNYASSAVQTNSGIISGAGTLSVSGGGTLALSGANTYTGPTVINAGVLQIQNASGLGTAAGNTIVNPGGTLELAGNGLTVAEPLSLFGTLSSQAGSNTYSGIITLQTGASIYVGAGSTNILSASTIGSGAFSKTGAGLLKLITDPNHTGTMTIYGGAVELAANTTDGDFVINSGGSLIGNTSDAINAANSVTINAGGLYVLRQSDGINMFSGAGTLTKDTAGAATLTVGSSNGSSTFSGVIENGSGILSFTKVGTGIQTLSGLSTYTNGTTLSAGQLNINNGGSGPTNSAIGIGPFVISGGVIDNTSGADITLSPNNAQSWNGDFTFAGSKSLNLGTGAVTLGANRTVTVLTNTLTVGGPVNGAYTLTKAGAGTLTLSGANTYSGATTVNGGKLLINGSTVGSSAVTANNGTTLGGSGTITGNVTMAAGSMLSPGVEGSVGTLSLGGNLTLNGNTLLLYDVSNVATDKVSVAGALTVNGTNAIALSFPDGAIQAGTYTLMTFASRTGTGTFVLSPAYANCSLVTSATSVALLVTGPTGFSGVTWTGNQSTNWNISDQNWTNSSAAVVYTDGNGVTFDDSASGNFAITSDMTGLAPGAVKFNNSVNNYSIAAPITNTAPLVKLGSGTVTLTGMNAYNPLSIIVSSGALTFGGASQLNNGLYAGNVVNNGTLTFASSASQTQSGVLSGSGALNLSGSGTLTLAGMNTYTGPTTVNAGATLALTGNLSTPAGATLNLFGTLSSQTGNNTYAGAVTLQTGAIIDVGAGSTNILTSSTAGAGPFTKKGLGLLRLTADPNHTGVCTVGAGTLELTVPGGVTTDSDTIINPGATLRETANVLGNYRLTDNGILDLRATDDIGGLDGSGLVTIGITGGSWTFTVGNANQSGLFSGVMENGSGLLSFIKNNTGVQTLTGTNTYTGTTTVNGGTLLVNAPGSLTAGSAVTVANTAILGGNGTVNGPVTLSAGGMLAPGGASVIGTLTLGSSLTLNGNSLFFDISNGATDKVAVASALIRNGVNTIVVNGTAPAGDYTLMTFAAQTGATPFSLAGIANATLELTATNLILHVASGSGANLAWKGNISGVWDGGIQNWLNNSAPAAFTVGDAVLFDDTAIGNLTVSSGSAVSPSSVMFNNNVNAYTVSAIIGGSASVSKIGTGTANLSGVNTYSGQTIVNQGTLAITSAGQLGSGNYAQNIPIFGGAIFSYGSSANQILGGVLSGAGALTKSGASALTLTNANTYSGGTTLSGGTLIAKAFATALGTGALTLNTVNTILELDSDTGVAFNNNATVSATMTNKTGRLTSGPGVTNTLGTLSINGSTLTVSQGANIASGTAGLTYGATTLTGAPTFDVGTGTLLTLGALGGSYNFTKQGPGTLFFGTAGSRTAGNSTLTAGTLKLGNAAGLGTTGTTNVLNGGILDLAIDTTVNSYITIVGANMPILSDKATANSDGITHALGTLSMGAFTLSVTNGPNVRPQSPFGLAFGATTLTGNALFDVANNGTGLGTLTLGAISGNFSVTKTNFGLLKLVGTNVYNGATTINNGRVMGVSFASCSNSAFTVQATANANANAGLSILCSVTNGQWVCTNLTTSAAIAPATALPALDFVFNALPSTNVAPFMVLNNVVFGTNPVVNVYLGSLIVPATNYPLMVVGGIAPTNIIPPLNMIGGSGYTNSTLFWTNNTLTLNLVGTSLPLKWNPGVTSSGTWDINNSGNLVWTNGVTTTYYQEPAGTGVTGDRVLFDDTTLSANSTVTLSSYVSPTTMTVSNLLYSYTVSGSGAIAGTNSLTKMGTNTLTLATANSYSGATTVNNGILRITGSITSGTNGLLTVGNTAGNKAILDISGGTVVANMSATPSAHVGNGANAVGLITMNSGTFSTVNQLFMGNNGGYGAFLMSGGTVNNTSWTVVGYGGGAGVMNISGGTLNQGSAGSFDVAAVGSNSKGVVNLSGTGIINVPSSTFNLTENGTGHYGVLNMTGNSQLNATSGGLAMTAANASPSGTGILNLNGGTLTTTIVTPRGTSIFNFNGGILKAAAGATAAFMPSGFTGAYIYGGGATIDDSGQKLTIGQPLLAPTGNGVSIAMGTLTGSGYIAPPYVTIAGTGVGATAVATIDGSGNLTGITLTSPGTGYTGTPTLSLIGGGGTSSGTANMTTGANSSGGLTKIGSGTLTLSAVNTYSGATVINNGKLLVMPAVSCANSAVTVQPSGSGATAILAVRNNGAHEQWTCNGLTTSAGLNGATANPALEFDFTATPSSIAAPLVVTGPATFNVTPDVNVFLVNVNVPAGAYPLMVVGGTAPGATPALTVMGGYSGSTLSWIGNTLMLNIVGTSSPIAWSTGATSIGIWDINNPANLVWKTDGAVPTYYQEPAGMIGDQVLFSDTYITANTAVILNTVVTPTNVLANNSTYTYTLSGSAIAGTTRLTKSGSGPLILNSANTYSGGTTIAGGGVLNVGNVGALGTGGVTNNGILNIMGGNEVTITGLSTSLSGAGTNNVTLGTGTQTTYMNGNHTGFTGLWNIGINAGPGAGRAQLNGNAQGVDNSAATINILNNATLWINIANTHYAKAILNGGDTGEPYGQLRLDLCEWAGPVILAGPITDSNDAFLGSQGGNSKISGTISELGGPYEVTKLGATILTLTGNNTFLGPVWVKAGSISVPAIKNVGDGAGPLGNPSTTSQARVKIGYTTTAGALVYTGIGETTSRIIDMAGTTGGATLDHSGTNLLKFTSDLLVSGVGPKQLKLQGSTVSTGEVAGVISDSPVGAVNLYKDLINSTWILSNTNLFTGDVTINAGKLIITKSTALGIGNKTVYMTAGTAGHCQLFLDGRAGPIVLETNIVYQVSNTADIGSIYNIAGTNTIKGNITITGGGGGLSLYSYADKLTYSGIITDNTAGRGVYLRGDGDGEISGSITNVLSAMFLTKDLGAGTWTLSGMNSYTGTTTVSSGTLVLKGAGTLASPGLVVSAGGSFVIYNSAVANNTNRWVDAAAVTLSGGVFSFSHNGGGADYYESAAGLVIGNGASTLATSQADIGRTSTVSFASLTRTGSGTINFTGNGLGLNTQNRILFTNMVASTNFIGLWATYNTTNLAAYDVNMGIIPADATAFTNLTAKGPSIIPDNQTLNARINEEGTSGGISLAGVSTNKINSLLQNTIFAASVAMPNKTLLVSDIMMAMGTGSLTLGSTPSEGFLAPLVASGQLQLNNQSVNALTVNASITNNIGASSLNKIGAGPVVLTGTNTYTGTTTIQEGSLEFSGASIQTLGGIISGSGSLVKSGTGMLTLNAANTYTGSTTISGGILKAGNAAALGSATVGTTVTGGGTLDINGLALGDEIVTVAGAGVGNAGALINASATTDQTQAFRFVTMTDDTTFGGARRWDIRANPTAIFDMGGKTMTKTSTNYVALVQVNVVNPGAINVQQGQFSIQLPTTMGGSSANSATVQSGATLELYQLATPITWTLALSNNAILSAASSTAATQNNWAGPVTLNGTGVVSTAATTAHTISGPIAGTGPLQKIGTGTATLSGTTTFGGGAVVNAGTLLLAGSHTYTGSTFINTGATLQLGDGTTTNGTISGDVTNVASLVFNNPTATTYAGVIRGSGTVTKQAIGTQILTGASTYSGTTTVSGGTLLVNSPGSLSNSAVTVNSGCILGGSGTIYGTVTMSAGSIMAPGDTVVIGTLTLGNNSATSLTLNGNTLRFDISNVSGSCDRIAVTGASGNLVLNGANIVELNFPAGPVPAGTYTLMTFASKTGTGAFALAQAYPNATLTANATSLVLTIGAGGSTYGLTWKGNTSSVWDALADKNWIAQGIATNFTAGDSVTFNDTATRFIVSSWSPVSPSAVLFNNSNNVYTVSAAIGGTASLVKNGASTVTLSGVSTYNPSSLAINAGTLALAGASQLNSGLYATNIFNIGTFNYASSATQTLSGAISGTGALTVSGIGTLTLAGTNTYVGATTVNSGLLNLSSSSSNTIGAITVSGGALGAALNISGLTSLGGNTLLVGNAASSRSVVTLANNVSLGRIQVGTTDNAISAGAVYHNSGTITASTAPLSLGEGTGDFGYYRLSGGVVTAVSGSVYIGSKGYGVLEMMGGMLSLSNAMFICNGGVAGAAGTLNIYGGILNGSVTTDNYITMGGNAATGYGQLNVGGSGVLNIAGGPTKNRVLGMMFANNNTNVINLLPGGTLIANRVYAENTTGQSIFNFNGGTLTTTNTSIVGSTFLQGLTAAYVYPGNAVIDTTSINLTLAQSLLTTTDYGVTGFTMTSNGSGYIGAPAVVLLGGSGRGATAIAQHDFNTNSATFGQITGLTVTCPGTGYLLGDTITVSLRGGGFLSPATATCTLGVNPASGGLTKLGSGTLTFSGTNTYAGATTISNGTFRMGIANALPTNSVVNVNGGIYDLGGFSVTNGAVNVTSGVIVNGRLNSAGLVKDGGGVAIFSVAQIVPAPIIINGGTLQLNGPAGLYEGRVNGGFDLTTPNPQTAVKLCPTNAYLYFATSGVSGGIWIDNSTYIYNGYIWNRALTNETWTFCKSFDDSGLIKIDGTEVMNHTVYNAYPVTNWVLTPGPHAFEVRVGQGTGGVGQMGTIPGIGVDRLGRLNNTLCRSITDPGDGSLLTLFGGKLADASTVQLAANTLLDLGTTAQTLAGLSGSGTVSNGTLTVTGTVSPAGTNLIGTLTAKANTTLSGKLAADVATDGTSDLLAVQGNLTLSSPTLEIQNPGSLNQFKVYTLVTCSGSITGSFTLSDNLSNTLWTVRKTGDNKIQLYYKGGTMIRIM